jgi:geranylgeranyl diphosphate synthase type I
MREQEQRIRDLLDKLRPEIDSKIEKYIPEEVSDNWLEFAFGKASYTYSKEAVQASIIDPIRDFLGRGGKRWRAILFLILAEALGGKLEDVKDFTIIPELIHNGTIIIDDIEDQGELRRGKPSLHKIFGTDVALNAGNFLYYLPLLVLEKNKHKFKPETLLSAYEIYIQEMVNIGLGQGTDIYWHRGKYENISEQEYLQMCAFKTGCLSRMAAKMVAVLLEKDSELVEKVGKLAEVMGVAFQIQDDILDISLTGEEREKFGKIFGNDIKEGKRTLMVIHALNRADEKDKSKLISILNKHTDNIEEAKEAIDIITKYGGIDYARERAQALISEAWQEANKVLEDSEAKERLHQFVYYLIERRA